MKTFKTTREVIDAIGGTEEFAFCLDVPTGHVINWRRHVNFPPKTYAAIKAIAADKGVQGDMPDSLFGMLPIPTPKARNRENEQAR